MSSTIVKQNPPKSTNLTPCAVYPWCGGHSATDTALGDDRYHDAPDIPVSTVGELTVMVSRQREADGPESVSVAIPGELICANLTELADALDKFAADTRALIGAGK